MAWWRHDTTIQSFNQSISILRHQHQTSIFIKLPFGSHHIDRELPWLRRIFMSVKPWRSSHWKLSEWTPRCLQAFSLCSSLTTSFLQCPIKVLPQAFSVLKYATGFLPLSPRFWPQQDYYIFTSQPGCTKTMYKNSKALNRVLSGSDVRSLKSCGE